MFKAKVALDPTVYRQAKEHAEKLGYSSLSEYVTHLIEKDMANQLSAEEREALSQRLKGLGYL